MPSEKKGSRVPNMTSIAGSGCQVPSHSNYHPILKPFSTRDPFGAFQESSLARMTMTEFFPEKPGTDHTAYSARGGTFKKLAL